MIRKGVFAVVVLLAIFAVSGADSDINAQNNCAPQRTLLGGGFGSPAFGGFNVGNRLLIFGLTSDQRLVCFAENNPGSVVNIGPITGFAVDTALIGIDYRVQDGKLYGVGNAGGIYTIDTATATLSFVNSLTIALDGTSFGVDFNPAADRLRVISNTGQNLRHNVNAGGMTINDGTLTYTSPTMTAVAAIGVTGAAYTNNDLNANTATTLFDIDTVLDQTVIQSPANNGLLATTGKLTLDAADSVGFDIFSRLSAGAVVDNKGFAVLTAASDGRARFYTLELLTGKASLVGTFSLQDQMVDLAIPLNQ